MRKKEDFATLYFIKKKGFLLKFELLVQQLPQSKFVKTRTLTKIQL